MSLAVAAGAVLVGAPLARAHAADARMIVHATDRDEPLRVLGQQLLEHRRDAGDRLRGLVQGAFDRSAQRMQEARRGMEMLVTFGYGLDGLDELDFSALAGESEVDVETDVGAEEAEDEGSEGEGAEEDAAPAKPAKPRRFEYVEGTEDPLAGL